jgi:hypothetical protein
MPPGAAPDTVCYNTPIGTAGWSIHEPIKTVSPCPAERMQDACYSAEALRIFTLPPDVCA